MSAPKRVVAEHSREGLYLTLVAVVGRCTCGDGDACFEEDAGLSAEYCRLCKMLDDDWPCPVLDDDADYPNPDLVKIDGAES